MGLGMEMEMEMERGDGVGGSLMVLLDMGGVGFG